MITMNKKIFLTFPAIFIFISCITAQEKDSLTLEFERLNRLGDSLHKEQLKRDSANRAMLERIGSDIQKIKDSINRKQVEQATEQVLKEQEKEQNAKRKTMLWALLALVVTGAVARIYFKRKKNSSSV